MPSIKYYEFESDYLFFLSRLEQKLEGDVKRSILERGEVGYDSGIFNVLYLKSKKIGKLRFEKRYGKGYVLVPKRASFILVVKGDQETIESLDIHLRGSNYEVNRASEVSHSTFSFTTFAYKEKTKGFIHYVKKYIETTHPGLEKELYLEPTDEKTGTFCSGLVMGAVEGVLETRRFVMNNGFGVEVSDENVEFRQYGLPYLLENRIAEDEPENESSCDVLDNIVIDHLGSEDTE